MNYCSACAAPVQLKIPPGDTKPRYVCAGCGTIHYTNPKLVVGCIPQYRDQILLCRRAIEPRYGLWTLPAGFMENHETAEAGALRETYEEALAKPVSDGLFAVISIPHISQVYMMFRATLEQPDFGPGAESLETGLFREREIPWDLLAFDVVRMTLRHYFADCHAGTFSVHQDVIRVKR